ncbi:MAG: amino acid adenylation domain-containing protein [Verrucomicrobiota bacterium]
MKAKSSNITSFLADLQNRGINLQVVKGKLKISGSAKIINEFKEQISQQKAEIISFLSAPRDTPKTAQIERCDPRPQKIPLSFSQQRLWFLQEMQPESWTYNVPFALELQGTLDLEILEESLNTLIERHEILRTRFISIKGEPVQEILSRAIIDFIFDDHRDQPSPESHIKEEIEIMATTPFSLDQAPLFRASAYQIKDEKFVILFCFHHIITDGWSFEVLIKELVQAYRSHLLGTKPEFTPLPIQYADFAIWQHKSLDDAGLKNQLDYWKKQLSGELPTLDLPTDYPRQRMQTSNGDMVHFNIPDKITQQLREIGQHQSASLFMVLLTAYKLLLNRYTGQNDLLVGCPIANRHRYEVQSLIGFFVNSIVIRTQISPTASFIDTLKQVRSTTLSAYENQDLPFEKLVEAIQPERDMSRSPIFEVKFQLERASTSELQLPGLSLKPLAQEQISAKHDLGLDLYETDEGLVGGFEYNSDLFKRETVDRMSNHFLGLLKSIIQNSTSPISGLSIFTKTEEQAYLQSWNSHDKPFKDSLCYHQLFEAQVERTPEAIALVFDNGSSTELNYRKLNERANQLAHFLIEKGIKPESVVGIAVERSFEMVISLLAVLKAGAAYLPLDRTYPEERLRFLLSDSGSSALITTGDFTIEDSVEKTLTRINLDTISLSSYSSKNPKTNVQPDNLAYLIYTSGSVGKPKGTLIQHRGLVNLTEDKIRVCEITSDDCILQFFSFSFDGSVPEFVMTLAAGAKLLLAPAENLLPGPSLRDLINKHQVSHITITPSALNALPAHKYPSLKMVLVGGEAPPQELIEHWSQGRKFINAYGPTETSVNASMVTCGNGAPLTPTVTPSANKQLYVLNDSLEICPPGVVGELHIGGIGLARGYHHRPSLTAERFIPNPFPPVKGRNYNIPLLYKSGDLASYLSDGRIKILGRTDHQTKIRGYRIELQEIETVLETHPDIKVGLVRVKTSDKGNKRLVAYAIPHKKQHESDEEIKLYLSQKMPKFMIPSAFIWLDELPLTPNGKLDEKALPEPNDNRVTVRTPPQTLTEIKLADIFTATLEIDEIGVEENFFELGGHSLLVTQLIAKVVETFGVELTVIDLFDAPTVSTLSKRIDRKQQIASLTPADQENNHEGREQFTF